MFWKEKGNQNKKVECQSLKGLPSCSNKLTFIDSNMFAQSKENKLFFRNISLHLKERGQHYHWTSAFVNKAEWPGVRKLDFCGLSFLLHSQWSHEILVFWKEIYRIFLPLCFCFEALTFIWTIPGASLLSFSLHSQSLPFHPLLCPLLLLLVLVALEWVQPFLYSDSCLPPYPPSYLNLCKSGSLFLESLLFWSRENPVHHSKPSRSPPYYRIN